MKMKKSNLALIGLVIALLAFLTVDHLVARHAALHKAETTEGQ